MPKTIYSLLIMILLTGCGSDSPNPTPAETMDFPPLTGDVWETKSIASFRLEPISRSTTTGLFRTKKHQRLHHPCQRQGCLGKLFQRTFRFHRLVLGKCRKTLTATLTGIAQQEGLLNINNKVSDYIGTGWTSMPLAKENLITNKHLLSMTSGYRRHCQCRCR